MSTEFKAEKPKFPAPFKIKDIAVYSQKLRAKDHVKYKDLQPILVAEGRTKIPKKRTRGIQAGDDDFSDEEEYKGLHKMTLEF